MKSGVIRLYDDRKDVTLTTYILDDSVELLNGKKRPAIIVCPGGAYFNCSDREGEAVALRFAAMGYHAFVLRYSNYLENQDGFPDINEELEVNPKIVHPAPMRDIGKALLTLRNHADEWLVDDDRITLCGFSAGAHNCAMFSVYWNQPVIYEHFKESIGMFRHHAVILGYGLFDYVLMKELSQDPMSKSFFESSNIAFVGESNPDEKTLREISPALHVNENTAPMFLWATSEDSLVPVQHTLRMAIALADSDIPFEVHIYEKGIHGLSLATQATAKEESHIDANAANWIKEAESWLKNRNTLLLKEDC